MKNSTKCIILLFVIIFNACKKEAKNPNTTFNIPFSSCKLLHFSQDYSNYLDPRVEDYTYNGDSIIVTSYITSNPGEISRSKYYIDKANKRILYFDYNAAGVNVRNYVYFLGADGYIDSLERRLAATNTIDYKGKFYRDASKKIIRNVSDYISYGYDVSYSYLPNGNIDYNITKNLYNAGQDSTVYTHNNTVNQGEPKSMLDELYGKFSNTYWTKTQKYNRLTGDLKSTTNYVYNFSGNGLLLSQTYNIMPVSAANYSIYFNYINSCH